MIGTMAMVEQAKFAYDQALERGIGERFMKVHRRAYIEAMADHLRMLQSQLEERNIRATG